MCFRSVLGVRGKCERVGRLGGIISRQTGGANSAESIGLNQLFGGNTVPNAARDIFQSFKPNFSIYNLYPIFSNRFSLNN